MSIEYQGNLYFKDLSNSITTSLGTPLHNFYSPPAKYSSFWTNTSIVKVAIHN